MDYKAVHNGTTRQLSHTLPKVVKSHKQSSSHAQSHTPETREGLEKAPLVGTSQSHALSSTSEMHEGKVPLIEIMRLHEALRHLPSSTPQGKEGEPFSIWGGGGSSVWSILVGFNNKDEAFEELLNPTLNGLVGQAALRKPDRFQCIVNSIQLGPFGLDGFTDTLKYLVKHGYVDDAMLHGKVNTIIEAIDA